MILEEFINNIRSNKLEVVDLTQPLNEETPILTLPEEFGQTIPFKKKEISKYDEKGPGWYWNNFETGEHTGTHLDSPNHWVTGKDKYSVDQIPVEMLIGNGCLIDMEKEVEENSNALLTPSHIKEWEKQNGNMPKNSWILIKTGWSSRFNDPEAYANFNTNDQMPNTPGISKERGYRYRHSLSGPHSSAGLLCEVGKVWLSQSDGKTVQRDCLIAHVSGAFAARERYRHPDYAGQISWINQSGRAYTRT